MIKTIKKSEPTELIDYKRNNRSNLDNLKWEKACKDKDLSKAIHNVLFEEQKGRCIYCERELKLDCDTNKRNISVEHFKPKNGCGSNINDHLDWNNLFLSCNTSNSCNNYKGSKPYNDLINPIRDLNDDITAFSYNSDGSIKAKAKSQYTNQQLCNKVDYTVDTLNLNHKKLNNTRQGIMKSISSLFQNEHIKLDDMIETYLDSIFDDNHNNFISLRIETVRDLINNSSPANANRHMDKLQNAIDRIL